MPSDHISKKFDAELETVRANVLQMGGMVEQQITRAMEALANANMALADQVILDDQRVNAMEVGIDDECTRIIAMRQPTASDLRLVMTIVKTITDLERVGDEAQKIARMSKLIHARESSPYPRFSEVLYASSVALDMLKTALDAFARLDIAAAGKVVKQDQIVDEQFSGIMRQLVTFMMEDPRTISACIDVLFIAKAIERIGDHAKNISEYVVYLVKGKDVRHVSAEEFEREVSSPN